MTNLERKRAGLVHRFDDPEVEAFNDLNADLLYDFNHTRPTDMARLYELARRMFAEIGEGCILAPPIHSAYGFRNVHLGDRALINYNVSLIDDDHIYIGESAHIAPGCVLATAGHPIFPALRRARALYTAPIRIGNNVWLGANCAVMPGVTIGDDSVIGAGSVVTKDIPAGVVAVGVPCKVLRAIDERDAVYYYRGLEYDDEMKAEIAGMKQ